MSSISPEWEFILLHREMFSAVMSTMQGVIIWDFAMNIGPELYYIFGPKLVALIRHGRRPSVSASILLANRLLVIPYLVTGRILTYGRSDHCNRIYKANIVLYALITAAGSAVFVVRTIAIRSSGRLLSTLLWLIWLTQLVVWVHWSSVPFMDQSSRMNKFTITCLIVHDIPSWTWALYLCFLLFDFLLLILTLESQRQYLSSKSFWLFFRTRPREDTLSQFFRDTWSYFALSAIVSVIEVAWVFQFRNNQLYLGLINPFHAWLCVVMAPRAIRNLLLKAAKAKKLEKSNMQKITTIGGFSSTNVKDQNQDFIAFDTSILSRINPAEHYYPPAHSDSTQSRRNSNLINSSLLPFPPTPAFCTKEEQTDSQITLSERHIPEK